MDPEVFTKGRRLTIAAQFTGIRKDKIDEMEYTYPVFEIMQFYLWPRETAYYPAYYYDPWFYPYAYYYWDPWWSFPHYNYYYDNYYYRRGPPVYRRSPPPNQPPPSQAPLFQRPQRPGLPRPEHRR
jgi:outer membrane lipoprotein